MSRRLVIVIVLTLGAAPAAAQPPARTRVEISANVGALTGGSKFTEAESFPVNVETETVTIDHGVKTAAGLDAGAAVRVVSRLWVGVQFATVNTKTSAALTALVPHPLLFNAPRTVQGSLSGVAHDEQNVHVDLLYGLPVHGVDLKVMAGPTFFNVKQDFVSSVAVTETYPFDTAAFYSVSMTPVSKGAVGVNAGVDVSRALSAHVGVGGLVRYARANVKFDRQTVKAGGVEAGGGVRLWF